MVKVCHITNVHNRYDERIFKKECVSLAEEGYNVTLIVNDNKGNEVVEGVKIIQIEQHTDKSRLSRVMATKNIFKKALEIDADIYHMHDPELLLIGKKLLRHNKKVIFDSHEDIHEQIKIKPYLSKFVKALFSRAYYMYETHICKRLSAVVFACPIKTDEIEINPFEGRCKKSVFIDNYPLANMETKKKNGDKIPNEKFTLCYAGGLSEPRGITNLVKACHMAGCKLILAGTYSDMGYKDYVENMPEFECVDFRGQCTLEEVYDIYRTADAGASVLLDRGQYLKLNTLPVKVFEFFQMGLPTIISDYIYARELNEKYPYGYTVNPDNAEEIAEAINKLASSDNEELKKNSRFLYENFFNWDKEKKKLFNLYEELI